MLDVLIVEDDDAGRAALVAWMEQRGFAAKGAATGAAARAAAQERVYDLALLDIQLPDASGIELLPEFVGRQFDVVLISGQSTLDDAIAALRLGAVDFLPKPVDMARLTAIVQNLLQRKALRDQVRSLRDQLRGLGRFGDMVGSSQAMQGVYERIERVAPTNETVLITGASGSGKEVAAATIHRLSRRADQPLVAINCGAVSATLIESEFFGHERGAFTGADRRRKGVFEQAHGGTLFLDEITEMPLELQVRLLRVLETNRITRVGGQEEIQVDVRIIAATNRDPNQAVADGKLRHDLLYRLLVFPIAMPDLKERRGDVELLAEVFLARLNAEYEGTKKIEPEAMARLTQYDWPGNVRELYNTVRRAYIMSRGNLTVADLLLPDAPDESPADMLQEQPQISGDGTIQIKPGMSIADVERLLIEATLEQAEGNKKLAAERLGISLKTLYSRLQVYAAGRA